MKVACMCQGGNSRSVACAYLLKYEFGVEALACSWDRNSPETLKMLFEWADVIIVMETHFRQYVPDGYHSKLTVIDVGPDVWSDMEHPCGAGVRQGHLLSLLRPVLQKLVVPIGVKHESSNVGAAVE